MLGARGRGKVMPRKPLKQASDTADRWQISNSSSDSKSASNSSCDDTGVAANAATDQHDSSSTSSEHAAGALRSAGQNGFTSIKTGSSGSMLSSGHSQHPQQSTAPSAVLISSTHSNTTSEQWRCAAHLEGGQVPELSQSIFGTAKCRQLLSQGQPVMMRGWYLATCKLQDLVAAQSSSAARGTESLQEPGAAHTQLQQDMLSVLCSPSDANRFMVADLSKNAAGSYYHLRKPETAVLSMSFEDWLAAWQKWEKSRLLLQADVCTWELAQQPVSTTVAASAGSKAKLWPNTAIWAKLPQLLSTETNSGGSGSAAAAAAAPDRGPAAPQQIKPSTARIVNWGVLQQLLTAGQYQQQGQLQLLAGGRGALLPAQYHTHDRLQCQVAGRQRLLLVPPAQCFTGCYPYPVAHPYDRYSCVDWEVPELQHWPAAAQLKGLVCELSPGDCLLVPAYWFVHSELQQPACVSLVLQLQPLPAKQLAPGALLLQLSRMAEVWMAAEVGTANVRHWFMALSEGREWQQLQKQLATVKGYKLLQVCHMIMQLMQQVLSLKPLKLPLQLLSKPSAARATERITACSTECSDSMRPEGQAGAFHCSHAAACSSVLECHARQMLGLMCEERLMPTHWLNQGISDSLYLKHQPQYFLIEEDAEAVKYSGLFKHRLIGNKPTWQQHAVPLQLASPGSGRTLVPRTAQLLTA